MFVREKEIIVQSNVIPTKILKNHLVSFPHNLPKYFKDIPSSFFDNQKRRIRSKTTIRTCSGFINLFKRSILFTSPYDIELFIEPNEIRGSVGGLDWTKYFMHHPDWDFINYANSDYAHILKFGPSFTIQCDYVSMISNAWWHMNDFEVIPGIINCKKPMEMNVFIPIKKEQNHLYIPQGTPLCYITFETDKQLKLSFKNKSYNYAEHQGLFYRFSNLKDKLLKSILK
jgi:hypothetical protein|tara:strand:+ start:60 stop:743 length:684 start_codon:yes stop_codon:yes gene_type:complete